MEITTNNPVSNQVQGVESAPKVGEVKREKEEAPKERAARMEENPDYRLSLSDESKKAVAESASPPPAAKAAKEGDLSEQEAAELARQASEQLAQTNAAISNQAVQNAVDLFT
jgi:hypothetical protein